MLASSDCCHYYLRISTSCFLSSSLVEEAFFFSPPVSRSPIDYMSSTLFHFLFREKVFFLRQIRNLLNIRQERQEKDKAIIFHLPQSLELCMSNSYSYYGHGCLLTCMPWQYSISSSSQSQFQLGCLKLHLIACQTL